MLQDGKTKKVGVIKTALTKDGVKRPGNRVFHNHYPVSSPASGIRHPVSRNNPPDLI
jgi:hypothetical protein